MLKIIYDLKYFIQNLDEIFLTLIVFFCLFLIFDFGETKWSRAQSYGAHLSHCTNGIV